MRRRPSAGSMQAMDFEIDGKRVNRLVAVKDVFRKFVDGTDEFDGSRSRQKLVFGAPDFAHATAPKALD